MEEKKIITGSTSFEESCERKTSAQRALAVMKKIESRMNIEVKKGIYKRTKEPVLNGYRISYRRITKNNNG